MMRTRLVAGGPAVVLSPTAGRPQQQFASSRPPPRAESGGQELSPVAAEGDRPRVGLALLVGAGYLASGLRIASVL